MEDDDYDEEEEEEEEEEEVGVGGGGVGKRRWKMMMMMWRRRRREEEEEGEEEELHQKANLCKTRLYSPNAVAFSSIVYNVIYNKTEKTFKKMNEEIGMLLPKKELQVE